MVFIKTSDHLKFMLQCDTFIAQNLEKNKLSAGDEKAKKLKADLAKLKLLAEEYNHTFSKLPKLSDEYNTLQRSVRVNMRKLKIGEKKLKVHNNQSI